MCNELCPPHDPLMLHSMTVQRKVSQGEVESMTHRYIYWAINIVSGVLDPCTLPHRMGLGGLMVWSSTCYISTLTLTYHLRLQTIQRRI